MRSRVGSERIASISAVSACGGEVRFFTEIAPLYEAEGRVGFVDWQTVALGPWVHDVNYFVVSALDVPDRRAHERDLLGHYLNMLATYGVSVPGLDEAWSDYRRATVHGFLGWLCNLDHWQPAEVNTATYARFGMAMIDHDTYAALGV